jgi:hypothetical protein
VEENTPDSLDSQDRRPIPGYEDLYEVDCLGNFYAIQSHRNLKAGRTKTVYPDSCGYMRIALCKHGRTKFYLTHRLVMLSWHPVENSDVLEVNHIDGNKSHNALSNLEWLTHRENLIHAHRVLKKWSDQRGEKAPGSKLTNEGVKEIRRLWADGKGMKQKDIAAIYNVTQEAISAVVRRKLWKHVE